MKGRVGTRRVLVVLAWLGVPLLAVVPAAFPLTGAAFTASSSDTGNSAATADVAAPSGFAAAQVCAVPGIAFRSASSAAFSTGSVTLAIPAGTRSGDLLVVQFTNRYDTSHVVSMSSGTWTSVNRVTRGTMDNQITSGVYWKLATGSEPASVTFSVAAAIEVTGSISAYSGVDTTAPVHAVASGSGSSTSATTGSLTVPFANAMLVHMFTKRSETLPPPPGLTVRSSPISPTSGANHGATTVDEVFPGTGSTPTRTATGALSTGWIAQTISLRPSTAVVPSASLSWTASPTTAATGYRLERVVSGGVTRAWTVTPVSATAATDPELASGTTYTYRLWAYAGTWVSPTVTTTLTPAC